jgi:glycerol-3-phosphate dehydrogenase (NAD(P)+)
MARVTVFGAGAMGTAVAMHLARAGNDTLLWASEFDRRILPDLMDERRHPALSHHLPESLKVMGPEQLEAAAEGADLAVMGAHSGGARTLATIVMQGSGSLPSVVGLAKGLEPGTGKRMSEVYSEEVGHRNVTALAGPCLAPEIAEEAPSAAVVAGEDRGIADMVAGCFRTGRMEVTVTDDLAGVEYCTVAKNVSAIGMGIVDGLAKVSDSQYRNAKAALFTQAIRELVQLVTALGGRAETAYGLAGLGDTLVTSLGGRNRLYGEMIGEGTEPSQAVDILTERGLTVEGVDSARDVRRLTGDLGLTLPFHAQVEAILFEGAPAPTLLDCMKG